jgi:serine/threonine protein phosphatase PrpC
VCDGVASAPGSDQAAQVAADTGAVSLADLLVAGHSAEAATTGAIRRAGGAVAKLSDTPHNPPACTYVSAVVSQQTVTIGWVGDSRAYWIATAHTAVPEGNGHGGSVLLTRDDSWADLMIARRRMSEEAARADPRAHLLTGWLGADADSPSPHTVTFRPPGPGMVVICSDGLWNHLPEPSQLESATAGALRAAPRRDGLLAVARALVQAALDAGGHDNVTVVLIPCDLASRASADLPAARASTEAQAAPAPAAASVPSPPPQPPDPLPPPAAGPAGATREPPS